MMFILMMLAAVWTLGHDPLLPARMTTTLKAEAARLGVPPALLDRALSTPERKRPRHLSDTLYCLDEALTEPGEVRRVCRSREDWAALGFEPV